jgi:hypothetical protein
MNLFQYNVAAACLHFLCFLVLLILYCVYSVSRQKSKLPVYRLQLSGPLTDVVPPISPNTLKYCSTIKNSTYNPGQCTVAIGFQQPLKIGTFNVIAACMTFFIITAIAHSLYAWNYKNFYMNAIEEGWNPYRWFEYFLSASLMSVILGTIQGSSNLIDLLFMAGVTGAMQFNGFTVESLMKKNTVDLLGGIGKEGIIGSTLSGWVLFVFLWFSNLYSFTSLVIDLKNKFKNVIDPQTNKNIHIPNFVYVVIFFQFFNYASFGFIQLYQITKNWNVLGIKNLIDFKKIEKYYLILSFAAKLGLAGGVSYGLILRTKNCPKNE